MESLVIAKDLFNSKNYNEAQKYLSDIIEDDPDCSEAYFLLANIFHIKGEIGKAIKAFTRVLDLDPNYTDAAVSLSVLYNDIGKYEAAKEVFDKANEKVTGQNRTEGVQDIHINKKFSARHFELAEMYLSYNRYDEALFEYNKALALNSENLDIRIKIAKVYAKKGFKSKAFDELKKVKNEFPGFIPARLSLGVMYYGNGNVIEAQNEWQKILAKDPFNNEAQMYLNLAKTATETSLSMN